MEILRRRQFQLGGILVLLGLLLDRIALRRLDNDPPYRRFWERVLIGSDVFISIGIFIALADPHR